MFDKKGPVSEPENKKSYTSDKQKNDDKMEVSKKEMIKEHKNLVKVLKSPSHKDDKKEAAKQEKELKGYESGSEKEDSMDHNCFGYDTYKRRS